MTTRVADDEDLNLRPLKRLRISSYGSQMDSSSSSRHGTQTPTSSVSPPPTKSIEPAGRRVNPEISRIPSVHLLLGIPGLVIHPPTHVLHAKSLSLARRALRRCLTFELDPVEECRAWTGLAEVGMMWLDVSGEGLSEIEQAITKALVISQKHPILKLYTPYLNILSARLAQQYQTNAKFAATILRRTLSSVSSSDTMPHHILFVAHLSLVHSYASAADEEYTKNHNAYRAKGKAKEGDNNLKKCLGALEDMLSQAKTLSSPDLDVDDETNDVNLVVLLVLVIRLQLLVKHGMWSQVKQKLEETEKAFETYERHDGVAGSLPSQTGSPTPAPRSQGDTRLLADESPIRRHPIPPSLKIHLFILSVLFYTYVGEGTVASDRLRKLHELLDSGVLNGNGKEGSWHEAQDGVIEIHFPTPSTCPLRVLSTPPRVLHTLAFLVSAVAKRDPVGRAPKKGVFARAGLALKEFVAESCFGGPEWAYGESGNTRRRIEVRMERIRADLMAEVVAISIMRSEFAAATRALDELVAYTRNRDLFPVYAARIALQHAQLLHAQGNTNRALKLYQVVVFIAGGGSDGTERDDWVQTAAQAGEIWIRIGAMRTALMGRAGDGEIPLEASWKKEMKELREVGKEVVQKCEGLGGSLVAIGGMLRACLTEEFTVAKSHLRHGLDLATRAQDNHLRAVILALVSAHYQHTARDHAMTILGTVSQLAAGLGAVKKDSGELADGGNTNARSAIGKMEAGNLQLRLWAGERMLELHRWAGEKALIERQECLNARMMEALQARER